MNGVSRMIGVIMVGTMMFASAAEERVWTGVNGRTFTGSFHVFSSDRTKATFLTREGQLVTVALQNLIPADRELLLNPPKAAPAPAAGDGFKELPESNRGRIPSLHPKEFGASDAESLTDALWIAMLWWDKVGLLEVPKAGDEDSKAEWLHKELTRQLSRGGRSAASLEEAKAVVEEFFADHHKDTATARAKILSHDLSMADMVATLKGSDAVVMKLTMTYENNRDFSICTVLEQLTPQGEFAFHVFGRRLRGKVLTAADGSLEFSVLNREELPPHYATQGARFHYKPDRAWNGLLVMQPFVYATKGKPSPLPPEEMPKAPKDPQNPQAPQPAPEIAGDQHPIPQEVAWKSSDRPSRDWTLVDGTRFSGSYSGKKLELYQLRSPQGKTLEIRLDQLPPDQRAALLFQAGCAGAATVNRLDLGYRFTTAKKESIEFRISGEGTFGRLEVPSEKFAMVFDLADGAFALYDNLNSSSPRATAYGRYEAEHLLHGESPRDPDFAKLLETFSTSTLPRSRASKVAGLDARSCRFPRNPDGPSMQDLEMDFVAVNPPVALTAISHLLNSRGPSIKASSSPVRMDMSWNQDFDSIEPCLARTRVLPLRMTWTNKENERCVLPEIRLITQGKFSLELVKATVPDSFPDGHFAIPAEARKLERGKKVPDR